MAHVGMLSITWLESDLNCFGDGDSRGGPVRRTKMRQMPSCLANKRHSTETTALLSSESALSDRQLKQLAAAQHKANLEENRGWSHLERWPDGGGCCVSSTRHHTIAVASLDHHDPKSIWIPQGIPRLVWFQSLVLPCVHQGIHIPLQIWGSLRTMTGWLDFLLGPE